MRASLILFYVVLASLAVFSASCAKSPKPKAQLGAGIGLDSRSSTFIDLQSTGSIPQKGAVATNVDLVTAVRLAVEWHPMIKEASSRLAEQQGNIAEARSGYYPDVSWGLDGLGKQRSASDDGPSAVVNVSQMIYDFGKVDSRLNIAHAGEEERRAQVMRSIDEVARDTAYAAVEVSRHRSLQSVANDQARDTKEIMKLVQVRAEKGAVTHSDLLQAKARVQAAEALSTEIGGSYTRWNRMLTTLTGKNLTIQGANPSWLKDACSSSDIDWANLPAGLKLTADRKAAEAQLALAKAEGLPTLSLDGGISSKITDFHSDDVNYNIGLKVRGSLYNGGSSSARRQMAQLALATMETSKARVELETRQNLDQAASTVASKIALLKTLQAKEKTLAGTKTLYQKQFLELGTRTLLDLLNVDQELHAARLERENTTYDLQRLQIDCLFNRGLMRSRFEISMPKVVGASHTKSL